MLILSPFNIEIMNHKKLSKELKKLKKKKEFHNKVKWAATINGRDNIAPDNPVGALINIGASAINARKEKIVDREIKKIEKLKKKHYDNPIAKLNEEIEYLERHRPNQTAFNDLSWTAKDVDARVNSINKIKDSEIDYRPKTWWLW